jgi:hypothetical protein
MIKATNSMASMSESGYRQSWRSVLSFSLVERTTKMSEATLFGFGAVIFFVVFTGASLFGMASLKDFQDRNR